MNFEKNNNLEAKNVTPEELEALTKECAEYVEALDAQLENNPYGLDYISQELEKIHDKIQDESRFNEYYYKFFLEYKEDAITLLRELEDSEVSNVFFAQGDDQKYLSEKHPEYSRTEVDDFNDVESISSSRKLRKAQVAGVLLAAVASLSVPHKDRAKDNVDVSADRESMDLVDQENVELILSELEQKKVWRLEDAKNSGFVGDSGEPIAGFKFISKTKEGERDNWKVESMIPESLSSVDQLRPINVSKYGYGEVIKKDGERILELNPGFYLDKEARVIRVISSEYLDSLEDWTLSQARFSGLLSRDSEPIDGYKFLEQQDERINWKIVKE